LPENEPEPDPEQLEAAKIPPNPLPDYVEFTDEERLGRYLDLHAQHEQFINLKAIKPVEYIDYVTSFQDFYKIPRDIKNQAAYGHYVKSLLDYLVDFYNRAFPLQNIETRLAQARADFKVLWAQGSVLGWEPPQPDQQQAQEQKDELVNLSRYQSAKELESLGLERLKSALMALGLKCGGSSHSGLSACSKPKAKILVNWINPCLLTKRRLPVEVMGHLIQMLKRQWQSWKCKW